MNWCLKFVNEPSWESSWTIHHHAVPLKTLSVLVQRLRRDKHQEIQITKGSLWAGYLSFSLRSKGLGGHPLLLIYHTCPSHFRTPRPFVSLPPGPSGAWGAVEPDVLGSLELE